MRHSQYLSKARRIIRRYEADALNISTTTNNRIALLGRTTNWKLSTREKIIAELEREESLAFSDIMSTTLISFR